MSLPCHSQVRKLIARGLSDSLITMAVVIQAAIIHLCGIFLLCSLAACSQGQSPPAISHKAKAYISEVLDIMQAHALYTNEIDWPEVRRATLQRAAGAQSTTDSYPAIFYALTQLKERHSFLRLPDNLPESDKARAYGSMKAILAPYKKESLRVASPIFRDRSAPSGHLIHVGNVPIAYVIVPRCVSRSGDAQNQRNDSQLYAETLYLLAASLAREHPAGWVIDLRGNGGGNMYPMLAGIGFLLGEGRLGTFISPGGFSPGSLAGAEHDWYYRDGAAGVITGAQQIKETEIKSDPPAFGEPPFAAVLIDSGTVSAGEAVAISFMGRLRTRFFGAHTYGLSTGNATFRLSDGASLVLCESLEADRNHRIYPDGVEPDVVLPEPALLPMEEDDPVIRTAEQWLVSQQRNEE
jgi:carboxyl-terminal processing protease